MKEIKIITALANALVKIIKTIRCESACCINSSCNQPQEEECVECKYKDSDGNDRVYVV